MDMPFGKIKINSVKGFVVDFQNLIIFFQGLAPPFQRWNNYTFCVKCKKYVIKKKLKCF